MARTLKKTKTVTVATVAEAATDAEIRNGVETVDLVALLPAPEPEPLRNRNPRPARRRNALRPSTGWIAGPFYGYPHSARHMRDLRAAIFPNVFKEYCTLWGGMP